MKDRKDRKDSFYMNAYTGSVDGYDGWWYEGERGETMNAADRGEVIEVRWDDAARHWEEVK